MADLFGADSAVPQPSYYAGKEWWGFYVADHRTTPHVWTQTEAKALASGGVPRGLPICVTPLIWPWALGTEGELTLLCAEAQSWGVPKGVPLCLDVEQVTAAGAQPVGLAEIISTWESLCKKAGYIPWAYGGIIIGPESSTGCARWLAEWLLPDGQQPATPPTEVPTGHSAWQFAGGIDGAIDLSLMTQAAHDSLLLTATLTAPQPVPPPEETALFIVKNPKSGATDYWLSDGLWKTHIPNVPLLDELRKQYPTKVLTQDHFNLLVQAAKPHLL